jgi:hypothetical protein
MSTLEQRSNNTSHPKRKDIMFYVLYVRETGRSPPPFVVDENRNPLFMAIQKAVQEQEDRNILKEESMIRRYNYILDWDPEVRMTPVLSPEPPLGLEKYHTIEVDRTHE